MANKSTAPLASVEQQKPTMNGPPAFAKVDSVMSDFSVDDANVRILGLDDYKEAAISIAEAFEEDDVAMYFVNTPDRANWTKQQKWELHAKIMEYITYAHLLKGLVVSAGPNHDCVGLW